MAYQNPIKVLIVDDSIVFREMAARGIASDSRIEVVGLAGDPYEARDAILQHRPDVLLLDIELPKMNGLTFLRQLMPQYPIPTVAISGNSDVLLKALEAGAVDYARKPQQVGQEGINTFFQELIVKIKIASMANVSQHKESYAPQEILGQYVRGPVMDRNAEKIVAIGASTGGTEAIHTIVRDFPRSMPGVVIVQHMPESFTAMYANRLNTSCAMEVKEAEDGDLVLRGRVLLAPGGNCHMKVIKSDGKLRVRCFPDEKINGHRPSVDVLFQSVAQAAGRQAIGVILTGMGSDGAKGILEMKRAGAYTIGQDESSCVVYGMPKVAYDIGGITEQLPLERMAQRLCSLVNA